MVDQLLTSLQMNDVVQRDVTPAVRSRGPHVDAVDAAHRLLDVAQKGALASEDVRDQPLVGNTVNTARSFS
jgi:hypothetical protein